MNKSNVTEEESKNGKRARDVDVSAQLSKIKSVGTNISEEVTSFVQKQPVAALGIAAGAGFILGSVFGTRLGRMALLAAAGYAAQELIGQALGEGGVKKLIQDEVSKLANRTDGQPS
jgi:hypothetical protein